MCMSFRSFRNPLCFLALACVTEMEGILHRCWNIRFTSLCAASNRAQPLWHLWAACALPEQIWTAVNPSYPCRQTRTVTLGSFSAISSLPFDQSTGGKVLRLPFVVTAKKYQLQLKTIAALLSTGKKQWQVNNCFSLADQNVGFNHCSCFCHRNVFKIRS